MKGKGSYITFFGIISYLPALSFSRVIVANNDIRAAVVGFRGHGKTHINSCCKIPGARVVALCDVDRDIIFRGVLELKKGNIKVDPYIDAWELLENSNIDIVPLPHQITGTPL